MTMLLNQFRIEMRLFFRRKDELFWTIAFPVLFILLFGAIYGQSKFDGMDIRSIDYLLPGIIVMGTMITGIMRTSSGFAGDREKGIYRRLSLTPLSRPALLGSQVLQHYAVIVIQTAILLAIGKSAFNVQVGGNDLLFWGVLTAGALCFISIGLTITCLVKTARAAMPINQMVHFGMMFLGGLFFPVSVMPSYLSHVASVLPSTAMNDALRMVAYQNAGLGDIWKQLAVLAVWMLACLAISIKYLRWE